MEKRVKFSLWYLVFLVMVLWVWQSLMTPPAPREITYKQFRDYLARDLIARVELKDRVIVGELKAVPDSVIEQIEGHPLQLPARAQRWKEQWKRRFTVVRVQDDQLIHDLQAHGVDYKGVLSSGWVRDLFLLWIVPLAILVLIWGYFFRKMGGGANVMSFGKARAKIYAEDPKKSRVTFADVAGIDEAVEEVKEIVDFLKNPKKYQRLGGKMPKGVLLVGPPGTGKTLLAKAVAGEAGVPFFSISGSEFVEMFVGVGAARVRDLFAQARAKAPCIVFIDEIDAIGRSRGHGPYLGGGHDERESTLNQLLTEMDGFDSSAGVVIMAATNRPDVLDPALLRPGRFDRQIVVDKPDLKGREAIFRVHTRNLVLADDVDLHLLAAQTPGFAGAEIANVCNEAALLAARKGKDKIEMEDFEEAIERVVAGLKKRNKLINANERRIVAYHESGHATVGWFLPHADPVHKVSIVPRGVGALGYTLQTPLEDRYLLTKEELLDRITALLGGRAAEELIFGTVSTGAQNDLQRATEIARNMVVVYGMSEKLGHLSFVENQQDGFLGGATLRRDFSEETARIVDEEIRRIVDECYERARKILHEKRDRLEKLAKTLLEKEVLERPELKEILGPSAAERASTKTEAAEPGGKAN